MAASASSPTSPTAPPGLLLTARRAVLGDGADGPGWVRVRDGVVTASGRGQAPGDDAGGVRVPVLAPGFVDLHCHGGGGHSFTDVHTGPSAGAPTSSGADRAAEAAAAHRAHGTTTLLASLVTAPLDVLEQQVRVLQDLVIDDVVTGVHLEGPWLSPRFAGAHDPALLRPPALDEVRRLLAAGGVRMVTLAPELEHGLDAVRHLETEGVLAAVGHTDADAATARAAFDAGARVVTHLFNAMRPVHHRDPGPVPTALADDRVLVELVADGVHVHPDVLAMAVRAARGGVALVTDAMAAACAGDGSYRLGGLDVEVSRGVARVGSTGAIAGSTLTMDAAVRCAVAAGVPLAGAVHAASTAPARALGLDDRGHLSPGARADVVCLDDDLTVTGVLHRGRWAGGRAPSAAAR
ncbi:N-acetylglucosamine-6-phosphate deacetylase [Thalassiella azotivora]